MTIFVRSTDHSTREDVLALAVHDFRQDRSSPDVFERALDAFQALEGGPLPYWVSEKILRLHSQLERLEPRAGEVRVGAQTDDDFRFVRAWWEVDEAKLGSEYPGILKGDRAERFYSEISTVVNWKKGGRELKAYVSRNGDHWSRNIRSPDVYMKPGLSWASRTAKLSPVIVPGGCIPTVSRYLIPICGDQAMALAGLLSSSAADFLCKLKMDRIGHPKFIVGVVKNIPYPNIQSEENENLRILANKAWIISQEIGSTEEHSRLFCVPRSILRAVRDFHFESMEEKLDKIQSEIDEIVFDLYGFNELDRIAAVRSFGSSSDDTCDDVEERDEGAEIIDQIDGLLSWAAGVAFGRFDWRFATGEREAPPEPDPFDPLPAKSPGMLPEGAVPFHAHDGILVEDQGHPHDLARLIEEILTRVDTEVPGDVRRWLQRDFFSLHLKLYSKSRRKAPIYWPLATNSGSYTLWFYYPELTSQTLYSAVNDFVEPKLTQISREADALRAKGAARSRDDEKTFETLQALELELIELRDTLLQIAPTYRPNHDDGVQITAAPLWQLFRHKPWQKILKDTWEKLKKGEYDWSHLAMSYWPDRVREKCKTDKSLAIAHDLEHLYVEPQQKPAKAGGRKKRSEA